MNENLNIDHHVRMLVLKALNKFQNHEQAAMALGICERTLYHYKKRYKIHSKGQVYYSKQKTETKKIPAQ